LGLNTIEPERDPYGHTRRRLGATFNDKPELRSKQPKREDAGVSGNAKDEDLSKLLRSWQPEMPEFSDFVRNVWRRIQMAY